MHQFFRQLLLKCSNFSQAQQELKWLALYVLEKSRKNGDMITDQCEFIKDKEFSLTSESNDLLSTKKIINGFNMRERDLLNKLVRERIEKSKPLQYIIGTQPFCDLEITVKPPVLIPRWETEEWTYRLSTRLTLLFKKFYSSRSPLSSCPPFHILDICTGSGCIALSLAHLLPPNTCHIYGIDNSSDALSLADLNLEVLNRKKILRNHVEFLKFDILEASIKEVKSFVREIKYNCDEEKGEGFDLIVSNPPYIARNEYATLDADVRLWEDEFALVADDNGTAFHNRITYLASRYLLRRKNYLPDDYHIKGERIISQHNVIKDMYDEMSRMSIPQIVMEIGGGHQVEKVTNDLKKHGFRRTEIWTDAANKERCVTARI